MTRSNITTITMGLFFILLGCAKKQGTPSDTNQSINTKPFRVLFDTTQGKVVVQVYPEWSPLGADRFRTLVEEGYYNDNRIFRVIRFPRKFVAQFGISGSPQTASKWVSKTIRDDPGKVSNKRGRVTFAKTSSPHSRTTQIFINYNDNSSLDGKGFTPFGEVIEGMDVADRFYSGYSNRPSQDQIHKKGNEYLDKYFPKMDTIRNARILGEDE